MIYLEDDDITLITTKDGSISGLYSGKPNAYCETQFTGKFYVSYCHELISHCVYYHRYVPALHRTLVFARLSAAYLQQNKPILCRLLGVYEGNTNNEKTNNIIIKHYMEA